MLRGAVNVATLTASSDCLFLTLARDAFLEAIAEFPQVKDEMERTVMFRLESERYPESKRKNPVFQAKIQAAVTEQFRRAKELSKQSIRFAMHERIGKGGAGSVYSGMNIVTGAPLAVKVVRTGTKSAAQSLSVEQESALMQQLRHPNVVQGFGMQTDPDDQYRLFVLMEYLPMGSLNQVLERTGCLSEPAVRSYARQALAGLQYLHRNGVVHRDIKPSNMLLAADGTVKLADFGISGTMVGRGSVTMALAGTPAYMSPEAIDGTYGVASDVWALGCSILELVTGRRPWAEFKHDHYTQLLFHIAGSKKGPRLPSAYFTANLMESCDFSKTFNMAPQATDFVGQEEERASDEELDDGDGPECSAHLLTLLLQMLSLDPTERSDINDILECDWFVVDEALLLPPDDALPSHRFVVPSSTPTTITTGSAGSSGGHAVEGNPLTAPRSLCRGSSSCAEDTATKTIELESTPTSYS